jgi:hypothetical protein
MIVGLTEKFHIASKMSEKVRILPKCWSVRKINSNSKSQIVWFGLSINCGKRGILPSLNMKPGRVMPPVATYW